MVVENSNPWLDAYRFRDFGEVGHPAPVWLLQLGIEQPQDSDIDAVMITGCPNNRLNVLPPGRRNRHGGQATDRATVGCHQQQLCSSWLQHHHRSLIADRRRIGRLQFPRVLIQLRAD
jgi:hypothetical protein